jgi:two-component system response regulator MprA
MSTIDKPHILIVDDDPALIELFRIYLEFVGYEVLFAADGAQAIMLLQNSVARRPLDIVMVDLMMPVMDGLSFIHFLRTELNLTLPVLALTGMSKPSDVQRAIDAGANAVLSKPIEPKLIIEKLTELLASTGPQRHPD